MSMHEIDGIPVNVTSRNDGESCETWQVYPRTPEGAQRAIALRDAFGEGWYGGPGRSFGHAARVIQRGSRILVRRYEALDI
jgi:hypothetical protein